MYKSKSVPNSPIVTIFPKSVSRSNLTAMLLHVRWSTRSVTTVAARQLAFDYTFVGTGSSSSSSSSSNSMLFVKRSWIYAYVVCVMVRTYAVNIIATTKSGISSLSSCGAVLDFTPLDYYIRAAIRHTPHGAHLPVFQAYLTKRNNCLHQPIKQGCSSHIVWNEFYKHYMHVHN